MAGDLADGLLGAVPVYAQVARRSYAGQGSIAMLEALLPEWSGKLFVLALLGFAATDFVITMTLSAADAAQHAVENPLLHPLLGSHRLELTLGLLALLAADFLMGFHEAIRIALVVAVPYIGLNLIVLLRGLVEILLNPGLIGAWRADLAVHGDWTMLLVASALIFPKQALGLSGMAMFALNLVLSARLKWLESIFGGMNKIYIAHHILGGLAFILLLLHPLFLSDPYVI